MIQFELDFKNTEEFKGKEISIVDEKFEIISSNQLESYKKKDVFMAIDTITKKGSPLILFGNYPIQSQKIDYYSNGEQQGTVATVHTISEVSIEVVSKMTIPTVVILMVVYMPSALGLQKTIQYVEYLKYINIKNVPLNVVQIIKLVSSGNLFTFLNFFGTRFNFSEEKAKDSESRIRVLSGSNFCRTHEIFDKDGLGCNAWNNLGIFVFQFIGLGLLIGLLKFLGCVNSRKNKIQPSEPEIKDNKDLGKIDEDTDVSVQNGVKRGCCAKAILFFGNIFNFGFFINFSIGIQLNILLVSFLGLKYSRFNYVGGVLSFLLSLLIVVLYFILAVVISKKAWDVNRQIKKNIDKNNSDSENKIKIENQADKWIFLMEGVKKDVPLAPFIVAANIIKDYFISLVVVFSVEYSLWQIIFPVCLIVTVGLFTIIKKPYEVSLENIFHFASNLSYLTVLILFLVIDRLSNNMSSKDRYQYLGTACVVIISLILIFNLIFALSMLIRSVYTACKKKVKIEQKSKVENSKKVVENEFEEIKNKLEIFPMNKYVVGRDMSQFKKQLEKRKALGLGGKYKIQDQTNAKNKQLDSGEENEKEEQEMETKTRSVKKFYNDYYFTKTQAKQIYGESNVEKNDLPKRNQKMKVKIGRKLKIKQNQGIKFGEDD